MKIEDNFIAVGSSHLINPDLKLQVRLIKFYGEGNSLNIVAFCYPELRPEDFQLPIPTNSRSMELEQQNEENLVAILETEQVPVVSGILFVDAEVRDSNLNLKIDLDEDSASFLRRDIENIPVLGDMVDPIELAFSILKCIVLQKNTICQISTGETIDKIDSINSLIRSNLAYGYFAANAADLPEFEPGWVCIASREVCS